jgi:hypothetical protein
VVLRLLGADQPDLDQIHGADETVTDAEAPARAIASRSGIDQ